MSTADELRPAATAADYRLGTPTWCPGCGDYGVLRALQKAAAELQLVPEQTVLVGGIGCSGKLAYYFRAYAFHGVHGRALPLATGIKLANPRLTVLVAGGDGDGYGIGLGHLLHAMRRDVDLTYIVMDNHIYGLTKGQYSATSRKGFRSRSSPGGSTEEPVHPLELALAAGCGFVAQGFAGDPDQLSHLLVNAIRYPGFALVNVLSPCVTFNHEDTYDHWQNALVNLDVADGVDPDGRPTWDRWGALQRVAAAQGLVRGVIYQRPVDSQSTPCAKAGQAAGNGRDSDLCPVQWPGRGLTLDEQEEYLARFAS